jgi:CHAD domain-containing protein
LRRARPGATGALPEPGPGRRIGVPLDTSVPRRLREAGYTVETGPATQRVMDLFDTGDLRLAAAGAEVTFSRRDGWSWRRDSLGNPKLAVREWTAPPGVAPELTADWSRAYRRGRPLAVRARVRVQRRSHRVSGANLAEPSTVTEERVDDGAAPAWTPRLRRIAVIDGDDDGVGIISIGGLFASPAVAAAATLSVLRPAMLRAPRLRLPPQEATSPRELFSRSTTLSMIQWLYFDCELSGSGSPDALRKLRVALRRLRSDLRTFAPLLDGEWAVALGEDLGGLADRLGKVRDAEVLSARLAELSATLAESDRQSALPLLDTAVSQLSSARAALLAEMSGDVYLGLVDRAVAAVTRPRWSDGAGEAPPVTSLAAKMWRRLRAYVAAIGESPTDEQLHRVRILAKRVRYAADASVPLAGEAAAAASARVAALQTVLGEQHDAVVTREWLRRHADSSASIAFAAGELAALELDRIHDASKRWRKAWVAASRKKDWRWLRS